MKKILFVSNTANFSKFNRPFMRWFKAQGWQVDYASMGEEPVLDCDNHFSIPIERSPYSVNNIIALKRLRQIIIQNNYNIIHCHTPMGGCLARLAAWKTKAKVLYTVHSFFFYTGAPIKNWLIYYPIEKVLSHITDCFITLNNEDHQRITRKFNPKKIFHIDGVGVDLSKFISIADTGKWALRQEYGYSAKDYILLCIAEFIPRKNHEMLFKQLPELQKQIPELRLLLAGKGELLEDYKKEIESSSAANRVDFLGYRNDINKLCQLADIHISPSKQEGLSLNNVEAMACGLPVVCSKIRGHVDSVIHGRNGLLFDLNSPEQMVDAVIELYRLPELRKEMAQHNIQDAQKFSLEASLAKMAEIYRLFM